MRRKRTLRNARYALTMSSRSRAITRGMRRGAEIGVRPTPGRMRVTQAARSTDFTGRAWTSVGQSLRASMDSSSNQT